MSNLTGVLRDYSEGPSSYWSPICDEAADKIDELEAEIAAKDARILELVEAIFNEIGEIE